MSRFGALPRSTALRCRSSGASCLGEGRNPSPSFASSRQGSTNRLSQPPFSFSYRLYVVSLSLRISVLQDYGGAHPLVMDALAEMSEAQMNRPYPSLCEYTHALPTRARTRETPYLNLRRRSIRLFNKASSGMRGFNSFAFSSKSEILVFLLSFFPSKD